MNYDDLNYHLLLSLGLYTNEDNFVMIDEENYFNNILSLKGKMFKYAVPNDEIDKRSCILFSPATSIIQAKLLLNIFLDKLYKEKGIYCSLQYLLPFNKNSFKTYTVALKFEGEQCSTFMSDTFLNNEALCYLDLIFKLDEIDFDLKSFDVCK